MAQYTVAVSESSADMITRMGVATEGDETTPFLIQGCLFTYDVAQTELLLGEAGKQADHPAYHSVINLLSAHYGTWLVEQKRANENVISVPVPYPNADPVAGTIESMMEPNPVIDLMDPAYAVPQETLEAIQTAQEQADAGEEPAEQPEPVKPARKRKSA